MRRAVIRTKPKCAPCSESSNGPSPVSASGIPSPCFVGLCVSKPKIPAAFEHLGAGDLDARRTRPVPRPPVVAAEGEVVGTERRVGLNLRGEIIGIDRVAGYDDADMTVGANELRGVRQVPHVGSEVVVRVDAHERVEVRVRERQRMRLGLDR